jgi:hypothetical protein
MRQRSGGWRFEANPWQVVHKTLARKTKKKSPKGAGGVSQGVNPEFKPQHQKKKKKKL